MPGTVKNTTYLSSSVVWLQQEGKAKFKLLAALSIHCHPPSHDNLCFLPSIQPIIITSFNYILQPFQLFIHPFVPPFFCFIIHPSIHVSMYPSIPLQIIFTLSPSFISTIHPSIHPSIQLSYSLLSGLHSCSLSLTSSTLFTKLSMCLYNFCFNIEYINLSPLLHHPSMLPSINHWSYHRLYFYICFSIISSIFLSFNCRSMNHRIDVILFMDPTHLYCVQLFLQLFCPFM